jgi:hypothetical protein
MKKALVAVWMVAGFATLLNACSADESAPPKGTSGGTSSQSGGAASKGGSTSKGGASSGGTSTGGSTSKGGSTSSGGSNASGGSSSTGGSASSGGSTASGGSNARGGSGGSGGSDTDPLGPCSGTPDECEAARIINEYRAKHIQVGECNEPLKWSDKIGKLAHDFQQKMGNEIEHSGYGYVENVGKAFGLRATTEYIIQFEADGEPHCNADKSYELSHHCAAMFCANKTVGIGIHKEGADSYAMVMMFGNAEGEPDWEP